MGHGKGLPRHIKPMFKNDRWRILRGDKVMIMAGKDKGQIGTVLKVIRNVRVPRVVIEGRNLVKRHIKRSGNNPGGIISIESKIHYSNVQLVDPVTNAAVRSTFKFMEDGSKVRVSRGRNASGSIIPRPEVLKQRRKPLPLPGPKDTIVGELLRPTYFPGDWPSALRQYSTWTSGVALCRPAWRIEGPSGLLAQRHGVGGRWRGFAASIF